MKRVLIVVGIVVGVVAMIAAMFAIEAGVEIEEDAGFYTKEGRRWLSRH